MKTYKKFINHSIFHYLLSGGLSQLIVLWFWTYISSTNSIESIGGFHTLFFWVELIALISLMGITTSYAKIYHTERDRINDKLLFLVISIISLCISCLYIVHDGRLNLIDIVILCAVIGRVSYDYFLNRLVVIGYSTHVIVVQVSRAMLLIIFAVILNAANMDPLIVILGSFSLSFLLPGLIMFTLSQRHMKPINFEISNLGILLMSAPYMAVGLVGIFAAYSTRLVGATLFTDKILGIVGFCF